MTRKKPETALAVAEENPAAMAPAPVTSMDALIARAASDPTISIDKLERLAALQAEQMAKAREIAFNEALRSAQQAMPSVLRDAQNDHTRSRYATLEAVSNAIDPIIHGAGFSLSFGTADTTRPDHYRVTCTVSNGGHSREYFADIPSDAAGAKGNSNKNLTQAFGSTMTYGRRYLKLMIFDVVLTNQDDDGHSAGNHGEPTPTSRAPKEPAPEARAPAPAPVTKLAPHTISTDNKKFVEWGSEFVAQINFCDNLRDLTEWKRFNKDALDCIAADPKALRLHERIKGVLEGRENELNARASGAGG